VYIMLIKVYNMQSMDFLKADIILYLLVYFYSPYVHRLVLAKTQEVIGLNYYFSR